MSKNKKSVTPAKAVKVARIVKNDVVRPRDGGKTAAIWAIAESLKAKLGRTPTRAEVLEQAAKNKGTKLGMASTQYGYWRRFMGITGRVSAPKPAAPKKAAKPAKKAATPPPPPAKSAATPPPPPPK